MNCMRHLSDFIVFNWDFYTIKLQWKIIYDENHFIIHSDEFSPGNASSDDDEETIAKEEEEQASDTKAEIAALKKESEMDLDDLDFLSDYLKNRDKIILSEVENDDDDTNREAPKRSTFRRRANITELKADEESNVS